MATSWNALAGIRGASEGDDIRRAFAQAEPLRSKHAAFRGAVHGAHGVLDRIVTMPQRVAAVVVAEAATRSASEGPVVSPD